MLFKIKKFKNFVYNFLYYRKILFEDNDNNFIFINKILILKLKKVEKYWGKNTDYIGDFNDKTTLKKLILELEEVTSELNRSNVEKQNQELNSEIYAKIGKFIPKLWT